MKRVVLWARLSSQWTIAMILMGQLNLLIDDKSGFEMSLNGLI